MTTLAINGGSAAPPTSKPQAAASASGDRALVDDSWRAQLAEKVIQGLCTRPVSVGRSSACLVQIGGQAATISRKHAEIVYAGTRCEMRVLGMNGVRVNGKLYAKGAEVALGDGDELNFVGIRYRFREPAVEAPSNESEEWWPESALKRALDTGGQILYAQHKRARMLADASEPLFGSADTLVNSSEAGLFSAGVKQALTTRQLLDDLPPSSPPMHSLNDMFCSEPEEDFIDDLPDSVDIESVTPASTPMSLPLSLSQQPLPASHMTEEQPVDEPAATPKPTKTDADPAHITSEHAEPTNTANVKIIKADTAPEHTTRIKATPVKTAMSESTRTVPAKKIKAVKESKASKENKAAKENTAPAQTDKPGKLSPTPTKPRKPKAAKTNKSLKSDDDMMASLRELLGVVDPSESLADSIDSETEEFLTTRPEQPISLASSSQLVDVVIETMVFSARTSHTVSDLLRDIARVDSDDDAARAWRHHLTWTLFHSKCFGRVERRVKDASDRRAEDRWYYDAARDECVERRENFGGLVRTARRCTLRDTQYFFKQVPKLPSFRYR
ncbi:hypothetical protein IWW50_005757 [Coemansia erecta]|nr:hypothetical protein IWW50_005757 [Coemansia erecta]